MLFDNTKNHKRKEWSVGAMVLGKNPRTNENGPISKLGYYMLFDNTKNHKRKEWSAGAMVLGKLSVLGVLLIWIIVGQGPTALAVGAGRVGLCRHFFSPLSFLFPFLWETVRYRLRYCLKGPLSRKTTNQPQKKPRTRACKLGEW